MINIIIMESTSEKSLMDSISITLISQSLNIFPRWSSWFFWSEFYRWLLWCRCEDHWWFFQCGLLRTFRVYKKSNKVFYFCMKKEEPFVHFVLFTMLYAVCKLRDTISDTSLQFTHPENWENMYISLNELRMKELRCKFVYDVRQCPQQVVSIML